MTPILLRNIVLNWLKSRKRNKRTRKTRSTEPKNRKEAMGKEENIEIQGMGVAEKSNDENEEC